MLGSQQSVRPDEETNRQGGRFDPDDNGAGDVPKGDEEGGGFF